MIFARARGTVSIIDVGSLGGPLDKPAPLSVGQQKTKLAAQATWDVALGTLVSPPNLKSERSNGRAIEKVAPSSQSQ
jgi:hypothetical protein